MFSTLISPSELAAQLRATSPAPWVVFDCSFDLAKPDWGLEQFLEVHVEGARHAHLDHDLSAHAPQAVDQAASGGRHPLPSAAQFVRWLRSQGVRPDTQVVVYDRNGVNYAGRLWWMCQSVGHAACAVLDGGLQAWQAAGLATSHGPAPAEVAAAVDPADASAHYRNLAHLGEISQRVGAADLCLIDARAAPRFRGEVEPLDAVAGHIPGALNRPFASNFSSDGRFKSPQLLRAEFDELLAGRDSAQVVHHCGSGVSAIPNLLAMQIAGLMGSRLFAGSWSAWSQAGFAAARG